MARRVPQRKISLQDHNEAHRRTANSAKRLIHAQTEQLTEYSPLRNVRDVRHSLSTGSGPLRRVVAVLAEGRIGYYTRAAYWQAIRMEGTYESSHQFSGNGFGGGRNSYRAWSVFAAYSASDEKGNQAGGRNDNGDV